MQNHEENHLVEDINVVMRQVEEDKASKAAERPLPHGTDVGALQIEVSEVGRVVEGTFG